MTKKRLIILSCVALAVLLVAGTAGTTLTFAQESTPAKPPAPFAWPGGPGWGGPAPFAWPGGPGWRGFGCWHGRGWGFGQAELEAAAKALGMTAEELSTQLWGGRTLAELADKAGVELKTVRDAVEEARQATIKDAIEQAVEDGRLTREQADWLLEGLKKGLFPRGFGFGRLGRRLGWK